jgi:hypothetical protein
MVRLIKSRVEGFRTNYDVVFAISDPKNEDREILANVSNKLNYSVSWAERQGYTVEYKITAIPQVLINYNCKGCRKRKSGDYFYVVARLKGKSNDENSWRGGWDEPLAKVCSKECGELMILRLV